jgi:protein-tyrosine phosphatase
MKILMVCLGNICRSPIAEGILRQKALDASLNDLIVDSCGFERYHLGDPPDERATKVCKNHNIDISELRQRLFKVNDFDIFDHIYVMDSNNYSDVQRMTRNADDLKKVDYILNTIYPNTNTAVPDPYYGSSKNFEEVYQLLDAACDEIIKEVIRVRKRS